MALSFSPTVPPFITCCYHSLFQHMVGLDLQILDQSQRIINRRVGVACRNSVTDTE